MLYSGAAYSLIRAAAADPSRAHAQQLTSQRPEPAVLVAGLLQVADVPTSRMQQLFFFCTREQLHPEGSYIGMQS